MNLDVWYLVCNGFTKISPSNEEEKKNSKALSDIINSIPDLALNRVMHYETTKEIWDKIQVTHERITKEDCSSKEPTGNHISKENNDASRYEYITNSKDDKIEEVLDLRRKPYLALKKIIDLKDKL